MAKIDRFTGFPTLRISTIVKCNTVKKIRNAANTLPCIVQYFSQKIFREVNSVISATCLADFSQCRCPTPCSLVKYRAEVSYFDFPDRVASTSFLREIGDLEEQRWVQNISSFKKLTNKLVVLQTQGRIQDFSRGLPVLWCCMLWHVAI